MKLNELGDQQANQRGEVMLLKQRLDEKDKQVEELQANVTALQKALAGLIRRLGQK